MRSGMIVTLHELGEVQVIGDIVQGVFVDIWGIGISKTHKTIMRPSGKLLADIMKACNKKDLENTYERAKIEYLDSVSRLDFIKEVQEKINSEEQDSVEI